MFTSKNYAYKNFYAIHVYMYLCNDQLCIIKFRSKIHGYQIMLKLPEHLKEEENSTENMVNNSVQKRKVAYLASV